MLYNNRMQSGLQLDWLELVVGHHTSPDSFLHRC